MSALAALIVVPLALFVGLAIGLIASPALIYWILARGKR